MKPKTRTWPHAAAAVIACALVTQGSTQASDGTEAMLELAWNSGCFNCHDLDDTVRGPAWRDVAERYRGDDQAFAMLRDKVRDGGSGSWGEDRMSPNRRVPMEDIDCLVRWLLTLEGRTDVADPP